MSKKVLSLFLALALLLSWAVLSSADTPNSKVSSTSPGNGEPVTMFVVTDNGLPLNVRSDPWVADNVIGKAPYGSALSVVYFMENGWVAILWAGYGQAYVQGRYLQWYTPEDPVTPRPTATPKPTAKPTAVPTATPYNPTDTIASLNAEFRTARDVTPFTVIVRPVRSSGWVNMRWAPGLDMEVRGIYYSGDRLTVIAETQSWYQVVDQNTEKTGFMMKTYTTRLN